MKTLASLGVMLIVAGSFGVGSAGAADDSISSLSCDL